MSNCRRPMLADCSAGSAPDVCRRAWPGSPGPTPQGAVPHAMPPWARQVAWRRMTGPKIPVSRLPSAEEILLRAYQRRVQGAAVSQTVCRFRYGNTIGGRSRGITYRMLISMLLVILLRATGRAADSGSGQNTDRKRSRFFSSIWMGSDMGSPRVVCRKFAPIPRQPIPYTRDTVEGNWKVQGVWFQDWFEKSHESRPGALSGWRQGWINDLSCLRPYKPPSLQSTLNALNDDVHSRAAWH